MILVTGGAGYIGTHTSVALLKAGHDVVVLDNLTNSDGNSLGRVAEICGRAPVLVTGDVRDPDVLEKVFASHRISAVVHFAGLKSVGESVHRPFDYYDNNVKGSLQLFMAMKNANVRTLIFSSSATVYGDPQFLPIDESHPLSATNPYGQSKLMTEKILTDQFHAEPEWKIAILRYFNPVGAHGSGLIGENPTGIPNNLFPYVAQVAGGRRKELTIWGNDYRTPDGTGIRDYIHVMDLAEAHVLALNKLSEVQFFKINLGTGKGYSVLDVVRAFGRTSGKEIPYTFGPRRAGDVDSCFADPKAAELLLGWTARRDIDEMCADHWRWQSRSPNGYC